MQTSLFPDYKQILILLAYLVLSGCSGIERSEQERVRQRNCKTEAISRNHDEYFYAITPPQHTPRAAYPWEGNVPRLTKEFFRCKGVECAGGRHGLPVLSGQEAVYPILLDLLNYVQMRTGKRVIITCGHCCPLHNTASDPSKENQTSKHQIGAEVDFYVQGMEDQSEAIVQILMDFYQGQEEFGIFQRYEKTDTQVITKPWFNKEIFIKLHLSKEGRDADNSHPHAYLTVQVRYDRNTKERVVYTWKQANLGYPRG